MLDSVQAERGTILGQEDLCAENMGTQTEGQGMNTNKSYENLTHTQLFIKNEAFPTGVSNNRYKWLPVTQGKSLKEQGKKQLTHWPISASSTEQLEEISLKYTTLHL